MSSNYLLKQWLVLWCLVFFGVVVAMSWKGELDWISIAKGFVPDLSLLWRPVTGLHGFIDESSARDYWTTTILHAQRERMIAAAATAVGINMTFSVAILNASKGLGSCFSGTCSF